MKVTLRALSVLLMLAMLISLVPTVVFAEGENDGGQSAQDGVHEQEQTRVDLINEMGYNFPQEGDTEIPKYKIVHPDGTEEIRYNATDMYDDSISMESGSTLVLLSDLYQSTTYIDSFRDPEKWPDADDELIEDLADDKMGFVSNAGRTLNFDFAGHTLFSEFKQTFFSCAGSSNLNVYSSEPGARLILLVENKDTGGAVITMNSGTANIGDFGEYPGENLSTYSAGGYVLAGGILNVTGVTSYRVATDYVSYFSMSGQNGSANFTRFRAFGVGRDLQIATREDGNNAGKVYGNVYTFQDCVLSNIGSPNVVTGLFFRYMADDNSIYFNNTVFQGISFSCEKYFEHEGIVDKQGNPLRENKTAVVAFDKYCSFDSINNVQTIVMNEKNTSKLAMFHFPEVAEGYGVRGSGVPDYIFSDGVITDINAIVFDSEYKAEHGIHDFRMHDLLEEYKVAGMYTLPYAGYEEDVVEVTWMYSGVTSEPEYWIKGENPTPYTVDIPRDTRHIQYVVTKDYDDGKTLFYSVTPKVNVSLKMNFTFDDQIYVNTYVPVYDDLQINEFVYRLTVAGTVNKIADIKANAELVELDGQQYYKVVTPINYANINDRITLSLDVANRSQTGKSFTISKRVNFTDLMKDLLDGDDEALKATVGDVLCYIHKVAESPAAITNLTALVKERFPDRVTEE